MYISAHFKILRKFIQDSEVKEFVTYHQQVLNITEKFRKFFKLEILVLYSLLVLLLCVTIFEVVTIDEIGQKVSAFGNVLISVVVLFMYSYCGQLVADSSIAVCDEFYKINKNSIIIIMRTTKPVSLKVGFIDPCMMTFIRYLNHTFSLMAVISHMTKL